MNPEPQAGKRYKEYDKPKEDCKGVSPELGSYVFKHKINQYPVKTHRNRGVVRREAKPVVTAARRAFSAHKVFYKQGKNRSQFCEKYQQKAFEVFLVRSKYASCRNLRPVKVYAWIKLAHKFRDISRVWRKCESQGVQNVAVNFP